MTRIANRTNWSNILFYLLAIANSKINVVFYGYANPSLFSQGTTFSVCIFPKELTRTICIFHVSVPTGWNVESLWGWGSPPPTSRFLGQISNCCIWLACSAPLHWPSVSDLFPWPQREQPACVVLWCVGFVRFVFWNMGLGFLLKNDRVTIYITYVDVFQWRKPQYLIQILAVHLLHADI